MGLRWLTAEELASQAPAPDDMTDSVRQYLHANCLLTYDYSADMIPLDTFQLRVDLWCIKNKMPLVSLSVEELAQIGIRCRQRTAVVMHGLKPKQKGGANFSGQWLLMQVASVWLHMLLIWLLPYTLIQVCIANQDEYAHTLSTLPNEVTYRSVFRWVIATGFAQDEQLPSATGRPVLVQNMAFFVVGLVFWLFSTLKLLIHYMEADPASKLRSNFTRPMFYVLLFIVLAMDLAYFACAFIWLVLGALIKPQEYLQYGVANLCCW